MVGRLIQASGVNPVLGIYVSDIGMALGNVNSCVNWVIYGLASREFRRAVYNLVIPQVQRCLSWTWNHDFALAERRPTNRDGQINCTGFSAAMPSSTVTEKKCMQTQPQAEYNVSTSQLGCTCLWWCNTLHVIWNCFNRRRQASNYWLRQHDVMVW